MLWKGIETVLRDLRTSEAINVFLKDIFTESEAVMIGRRVHIAQLLLAGMPQREICERMHVGISTVQTVDRWLRNDAPDYRTVFSPLYKQARQRKLRGRPPIPLTFAWVRKKYPMHFLLFNLLLDGPTEADD